MVVNLIAEGKSGTINKMIKAKNLLANILRNAQRIFSRFKIMKLFQVSLTKSYLVNINAENEVDAKRFAEFFTGDIQDISDQNNRKEYKFEIEEIECAMNEAFEAEEV